MFAYCNNNPIMGYDPTGTWDWGGVIIGLALVAAGIITVATAGTAAPVAATIVAAATTTTGAVMTYAAATDSQMVIAYNLFFCSRPCLRFNRWRFCAKHQLCN